MKKVMSALAVSAMLMSALPTSVMDAAARISIYINDAEISSAQAPVMKAGRVLVPLRSIFEGLDAKVQYTNKTKTIKATRGDQEVSLTLGSKVAYINGEAVALDVPANTIKGSTMVPIRFVSEAFGEKVFWNSRMQRVDIKKTVAPPVDDTQYSAWNIYGSVSGSNGDGRDLTVSFTRPTSERAVSAYRVMLVKTRDVNGFNETSATAVPSGNYTSITPNGNNPKLTLNAQTRDVNGDLLNSNETYRLYVLTVGNNNNNFKNTLSWSSQTLKLSAVKTAVQSVTSLRAADISDYGDGRDLEINFTQPSNTSNITYYRAFVVKAKDASSFNLAAANKVSNSNSTIIYKANTQTMKSQFSSSTRDTSGEIIKNGTAYVVYILSVSTNAATTDNKLSAASASLTLGVNATTAPVITQVKDNSDYGDGRDIQVSFNRSSDESKVSSYRIFVVRNAVSSSFNLTTANNLSSNFYYTVNKTGNNITTTLPSSMKDTSGYNVTNLQDYRIYVLAVGNNGAANILSSSSAVLRLTNNGNAGAVSNLTVADVSDYGNSQDLRVSFTKATDESRVSSYRVFVVPSGNVGSFTLNAANASSYYQQVNKTGGNQTFTLSSGLRDVYGTTIREGVSYRVFVLSVSSSGNASQNSLSGYSLPITLTKNTALTAPAGVQAADIADNGNGSDLQVTFNRPANEANIYQYRVFVVKSGNVGSFNLAEANRNSNFKIINKAGGSGNYNVTLDSNSKATDGTTIGNDVNYRVFVLAMSNNDSIANALSTGFDVKLATTSAVGAVSAVKITLKPQEQAVGNSSDLMVSFDKPRDASGISSYALMIVPSENASSFIPNTAKAVLQANYYQNISKDASSTNVPFFAVTPDVNGNQIVVGKTYQAFIVSVSETNSRSISLSEASNIFKVEPKKQEPVEVKTATLTATDATTTQAAKIMFTPATDETGISEYRVFVVEEGKSFNINKAIELSNSSDRSQKVNQGTTAGEISLSIQNDTEGNAISNDLNYGVYVLSVAKTDYKHALFSPSNLVKLKVSEPTQIQSDETTL
ncbi:copper amine oxidase N-terminal domain-containing protein [Paenibacillus tundrae]|uniref:copper amine oxidase N-terminal domain-containing protein n=1 Tax=Paenibacillus tundrae TaxID=528187 RepID=UPI0030D497CB